MLRGQRNDDGRILGPLALVNSRRVRQGHLVEFAEAVRHLTAVELDDHLRGLGIDAPDDPEITVVDVLFIVVLDLHDFVANAIGRAEAFDAELTRAIERLLQIDVEGPSAEATAVHRAQHLDVTDRIEAVAGRDALADDLQDLGGTILGIAAFDEMEVAGRILHPFRQSPLMMRWALTMMRLSAAWRNTSMSRTTGTAADPMTSASTWPGPTDGSWSTSPTRVSCLVAESRPFSIARRMVVLLTLAALAAWPRV